MASKATKEIQIGIATQLICHDSKYKSANISGHVVTAAVSAAALAALFKYVRQPSLAVLTGSSVACIALPTLPLSGVAFTAQDEGQQVRFHPLGKKAIQTSTALSGFVAGAQMVLIGSAALRTWNSGLSRLKKMGIAAALTLSTAELVVVKGYLLAYSSSRVVANDRAEGKDPYPTYDPAQV